MIDICRSNVDASKCVENQDCTFNQKLPAENVTNSDCPANSYIKKLDKTTEEICNNICYGMEDCFVASFKLSNVPFIYGDCKFYDV